MRNLSKKLLVIFLLGITNIILGEGWTQKAGNGYYALDFRLLSATKYHDSRGDNIEIDGLTDFAFNLYTEYGITNELTAKLNFPFYKSLTTDGSQTLGNIDPENNGVGDIDLGFRYKIKQFRQTSISGSLTFGIPISTDEVFDMGQKFALSDGEFNQKLGIEVGHSLFPLPAYISGTIKFNNRNEGYSDQLIAGFEGGYNVRKNLLLNLRFHIIKSFKNGDKDVIENVIPIHANDEEYFAVKVGGFFKFHKNFGLAATGEFGLAAKNILSAPVFSIGLYVN